MYIFCTDCWLIAVLYFTWLVFDWNTPKKGKCKASLAPPLILGMLSPLHKLKGLILSAVSFNTHFVKSTGLVLWGEVKSPSKGTVLVLTSSHSVEGLHNMRE